MSGAARAVRLEVGPELVGVLEPDGEAEQSGRARGRPPSGGATRSVVDAAEARRVLDHAGSPSRPARWVGVGDVEGEQPAEAGVADGLDRRMARAGARPRTGRVSVWRSTRTRRVFSPRGRSAATSGAARSAGALAEAPEPLVAVRVVAADDRAGERVGVAGQVLRRQWSDEVGAVLQRPQVDGRSGGRVDDDAAPGGRRPPRGRASSGTGSTAPPARSGRRRRAAGRSGRTRRPEPPAPSASRSMHAGAEVAARGERDRVCPARAATRASAVVAPEPEEKSSARAALELAERASASTPVGCAKRW